MSKILASLVVAGLSTVGLSVSDSTAMEVAMVVINVGSLGVAYASRVAKGDVTWYGKRRRS